jgi:RNA polymerase sigma factor (sigma-70 family)
LATITNLIEKVQKGNLDAFEELVLQYQDRVYSHCCLLSHNPDDAQDLAQDVFVQAFKGIKSFRNDADFGTWLHKIAVNLWINYQRKNKKVIVAVSEGAKYADELIIETTMGDLSPVRVELLYTVTRKEDGKVLAKGKTVQTFVDKNCFKIVNLKKKYPEMWSKLEMLK